ncbi:nitroreductase [Rhodobacterales bacterium]|nr:nitroreductase [Rhodobacterales bacterium]
MPNETARSPETLEFLRTRRSHPSVTMTGPGPDKAEIEDILTIAARVPDHGKLAPWRFILYPASEGKRIGEALTALHERKHGPLEGEMRTKELTRFTRAPVIIGVLSTAADHPKIPLWEQQLSAGAVCMNLVTAAAASGFVSQWLTEWYSFDEEAARYLGAREGERFAGFIQIGTPTLPPVERPRPALADLITNWEETS